MKKKITISITIIGAVAATIALLVFPDGGPCVVTATPIEIDVGDTDGTTGGGSGTAAADESSSS